ncbi:MAG: DUF4831 family protein [Rikenellaceae bacterium]
MKKYILSLLCVVAVCGTLSAINPQAEPYGWVTEGDQLTFSLPSTQLSVSVVVEKREFKAGVYARYGSKYLGINCELADKCDYSVVDGSVSLLCGKSLYNNSLETNEKYPSNPSQYTPLPQGGMVLSEERRAQEVASRVFAIRRQREDLISGDVGEGVFGAGLEAALESMKREEQQLLELFIGCTKVTQSTKQFSIQPDAELKSYIICRFSSSEGVVGTSSLSASPIYLQITPGKMPSIQEAQPSDRAGNYAPSVMDYMVAAQCQCTLFNDTQSITEAMLPIFEFGRVYKLNLPRKYQIKHFGHEIK